MPVRRAITPSDPWDPQDRLTSLEQPCGARLTSTYRHDGLRHARVHGTGTQTFLWDGQDVLAVEGVNARRFARGVDLARNLGDGLGQVFHLDALGTVQALSAADGSEVTRYGVDPWGNVQSGSAAGNAYVYHGGLGYWEEPGAGLSYVRARWLEPETGSWLSVDPVTGEPRYSYARQMPTAFVDPTGALAIPLLPFLDSRQVESFFQTLGREGAKISEWVDQLVDLTGKLGIPRDLLDRFRRAVEQALQGFTRSTTAWLRKLAPPSFGEPEALRQYVAGAFAGLAEVLLQVLVGIVVGIALAATGVGGVAAVLLAVVSLLAHFCQHGVSWDSLLSFVLAPIQEDLDRVAKSPTLEPYTRGRTAVHIGVGGLILVIMNLLSMRGGVQALTSVMRTGVRKAGAQWWAAQQTQGAQVRQGIATAGRKVQEVAAGVPGQLAVWWQQLEKAFAPVAGKLQGILARIRLWLSGRSRESVRSSGGRSRQALPRPRPEWNKLFTVLPGKQGIEVPRRVSAKDMAKLQDHYDREFALIYQWGPGENGSGGKYFLFSGTANEVTFDPSTFGHSPYIEIWHTHPRGSSALPSTADLDGLAYTIERFRQRWLRLNPGKDEPPRQWSARIIVPDREEPIVVRYTVQSGKTRTPVLYRPRHSPHNRGQRRTYESRHWRDGNPAEGTGNLPKEHELRQEADGGNRFSDG